MIMRQYLQTNISPNSRPLQQSSPSENSMSTATPPHQVSRASPASTALVMSQNNINNGSQSASRQLTPNNSSLSNNGTDNSNGSATNHGVTHNATNNGCPPNPMARQFACHSKSMSAGVVVPVPGISNNLATITGMNQNNMINNNIIHNQQQQQQHHHHHHRTTSNTNEHQSHHHHQNQQQPSLHHRSSHHPQQISKDHRSQHLASSNNHHHHHNHQNNHPLPGYNHTMSNHAANHQTAASGAVSSSGNFVNGRQATGSSIILNNNNINNLHNRSASTHLSNVFLGPGSTQSNNHMTNPRNYPPNVSIWSIDENISKSHGKLTASSYISHPYLLNPSMTDMSCDNVSNASRLIDGAPATSYYMHAPANPNPLSSTTSIKSPEFLPICDLLFNLISMIIYFCESTFGIIALVALYYHTNSQYWSALGLAFVITSNVVCQYLSLKWLYKAKLEESRRKREAQEELEDEENCERRYYNRMASNLGSYQCGSCSWLPDSATEVQLKFLLSIALNAVMHLFCLGFIARYLKLVIPVSDTARVKKEARDLCMLRMLHAFIQSAPLLLLQAYMTWSQSGSSPVTNLSITAAMFSLLNVCWALASFTKYARKKYMHRFALTWLGIISQLLWRLGTISSRVVALIIYAVYYNYWMLVVLALHWITMFLWLIKPGNLLRDEVNLSRGKKISWAMAAAWIYCFCYMNFEENNSKIKMVSYYLIMLLENTVLLMVSLILSSQVIWLKLLPILIVYLGFVLGMLFMFLYYKYFHVNILNNGLSCSQESIDSIADQLSPAGKKIAGFKPGTLRLKNDEGLQPGHRYNSNISTNLNTGSHPEITRTIKPPYLTSSQHPTNQTSVFNCQLNTALKKQKMSNNRVRRHNG